MTTNPIDTKSLPKTGELARTDSPGGLQLSTPAEFLPPINMWMTVGGLFLVSVFGIAIGLSTVLKYKVSIQAGAAIRPVGELRIVQSQIEGTIVSILAKENQTVRQGDIIAKLNDDRLKNKQIQLVGDIQKSTQQIGAIDAQILALDRQIAAEVDRTNRAMASVQAERLRFQRDYQDKQITSRSQVAEAAANFMVADKERQVAEVELKVNIANLKSVQAVYQSAVAKAERYRSVAQAGAISKNQLEEAELAVEQQAQAINAQQATLSKQQQIIARLQYSTKATQAVQNRAQAALNPSTAEITMTGEKIALERATGVASVARLQKEREQLLQQRMEIQSQIVKNQTETRQGDIDIQATVIRAPVSGIIQELNLRNNRQVLRPGDRIAQIAPSGTPMTIKAAVTAQDIGKVQIGQIVQMRVSACPYTEHGVLAGKVVTISPDAKSAAKAIGNEEPTKGADRSISTYEVTVKPDTSTLSNGKAKCPLQPGMEGRVDIISKEESVMEFMLKKARLLVNI